MVFNATLNYISWRSVLLVEETGENHRPVTSHWQTLSLYVVSSTPRLSGIKLPYDHDHDGSFIIKDTGKFICYKWETFKLVFWYRKGLLYPEF